MGISFSCSGEEFYDALDDSLEALIVRSISFSEDLRSSLRSVSFNGRDSEPAILKAFGSGKLFFEGSLSFNGREMDPFHLETTISIKPEEDGTPKSDNMEPPVFTPMMKKRKPLLEVPSAIAPDSPKHEAALTLQKVYKSFRTRRRLADCAVLVEQHWWKVIEFALLKRSSVSFFDIEKPESAVSKWSRARTRAAKVGKGLSKDEKAQKLALQHWLEAIDPRHRYGHNLHYYYDCWLRCESKQPFFYWLDVGDGKEVNLEEHCTRSELQQQCIKYLGPKERENYEVIVEDGKFMYKLSRKLLHTTGSPEDAKWIFVLSTAKTLYVGQKKKGTFQHSSFLAGGATSSAGRLVVEDGVLKAVWPHSGHYRPTEENFQEFMSFLEENNVDLTNVKKFASEEDAEVLSRLGSSQPEQIFFESDDFVDAETETEVDLRHGKINTISATEGSSTFETSEVVKNSCSVVDRGSEEQTLQIKEEAYQTDIIQEAKGTFAGGENKPARDSNTTEGKYMFVKRNLFLDEKEEEEEALVPPELILRRITSKKGMKSYQLGKQLTFRWTTGAGPRIGCVRDYPSELQLRALEQVNLSPRSGVNYRLPSPRPATGHTPRGLELPSPKELPQVQRLKFEK